MIDIHTHILPFVDDGSQSVNNSIEIMKVCYLKGVREFIFTPHYRKDEYEPDVQTLLKTYSEFTKEVERNFEDVKTYLGEEVFCDGKIYDLLKSGKVLTINNTKAVLLEFNYTAPTDIADYVYNIKSLGYLPIVAHVERYEYLNDESDFYEIKQSGALIQVNASSIVGKLCKPYRKKVIKLLKNNLVDFISSDVHEDREVVIDKAYEFISKKFSKSVADDLFENNAKKYLING